MTEEEEGQPMKQAASQSDVARLLDQIEIEYCAAQRGLTGFAEGAGHAAITTRMEHMSRLHDQLRNVVGEDAMKLLAERLDDL